MLITASVALTSWGTALTSALTVSLPAAKPAPRTAPAPANTNIPITTVKTGKLLIILIVLFHIRVTRGLCPVIINVAKI